MSFTWLRGFVLVFLFSVPGVTGVEYVNVAFGKPTKQKDTAYKGYAEQAVDGNRSPAFFDYSCTHTWTLSDTWWAVDLLSSYKIHSVAITNRDTDPDRLKNFVIYVSDVNPLPIPVTEKDFIGQVCLNHPGSLGYSGPHTLICDQVLTGRYVYLWKPGHTEELIICEFEVMAISDKVPGVKEEVFNLRPGQKSKLSPFYSTTIPNPSKYNCIKTCWFAPGGAATIVQLEGATGLCECIQASSFLLSYPNVTAETGWTVMETVSNN